MARKILFTLNWPRKEKSRKMLKLRQAFETIRGGRNLELVLEYYGHSLSSPGFAVTGSADFLELFGKLIVNQIHSVGRGLKSFLLLY